MFLTRHKNINNKAGFCEGLARKQDHNSGGSTIQVAYAMRYLTVA